MMIGTCMYPIMNLVNTVPYPMVKTIHSIVLTITIIIISSSKLGGGAHNIYVFNNFFFFFF